MKFRTEWYRDQQQARQELAAAKSAARRRRPRANVTVTWNRLEGAAVDLSSLLEDALAIMRSHPTPGQRPEISVSLISDSAEDPSPMVLGPARAKPITPLGRHRIVAGGRVERHAVIAKIEIVAKLVVYGLPGEAPPPQMSRRTWLLPVKAAEKQKNPVKTERPKNTISEIPS